MRTVSDLLQRQALPLEAKISMSLVRIREWYNFWGGDVYISFSGGKDSTVLAHLVRSMYPDVPAVYSNTGLEYFEVQKFAHEFGCTFVNPKYFFSDVISKYGYPILGKEISEAIYYSRMFTTGKKDKEIINKRFELCGLRMNDGKKSGYNKEKWRPVVDVPFMIGNRCCYVMKKSPLAQYQKKTGRYPYIGTLAEESILRRANWIRYGCNSFDGKKKTSQPLAFWTEQDILQYIKENNIAIASVYGSIEGEYGNLHCTGCNRTGCIFCGYGCHLEKGETRFQRLAKTHPRQYEYCLGGGQWVDNPNYDEFAPEYDDFWKNWNPKKIWVPSKEGLGMRFVFDCCNEIYGKEFIRYE